MQRIAFFEDNLAANFTPIALLRPVHELLCGHFSLRQRALAGRSDLTWGAFIRENLAEVCREEHPDCAINDMLFLQSGPTVMVNSRWLSTIDQLCEIEEETTGWLGGELAWITVHPEEVDVPLDDLIPHLEVIATKNRPVDAAGHMLHFPWDLIHHNPKQLEADFLQRVRAHSRDLDARVAIVGQSQSLYVHPTADIDPFVVIDVRNGPVWIDAEAKIQAFTRIEGPAYIGPGTQTFRANIREGTSIGPVCRVGGEIEESIIHGYANKYHDGFLGHSYVCPWVNLGALTTNSDLKNDYSNVSVPLSGKSIKTDSNKVGCFIGDHTKTALCSLFNTGSSIGVGCLILPGGELLPKHIPSFSRIWHGQLEALPAGPESTIETARYAMQRRNQSFTPAIENLLRKTCEQTQTERLAALQHQSSHQQSLVKQ